jgi:hypothetical protein
MRSFNRTAAVLATLTVGAGFTRLSALRRSACRQPFRRNGEKPAGGTEPRPSDRRRNRLVLETMHQDIGERVVSSNRFRSSEL